MKDKGLEEVIKKKWPKIEEEDWKQFLASHSGDDFTKKSSKWNKMREFNTLIGSHGYLGKKGKWDKEDATVVVARKEPPLSYIEAGRGRDFVRTRASYGPVTREPVFKSINLADVHDNLMVFGLKTLCSTRRRWNAYFVVNRMRSTYCNVDLAICLSSAC